MWQSCIGLALFSKTWSLTLGRRQTGDLCKFLFFFSFCRLIFEPLFSRSLTFLQSGNEFLYYIGRGKGKDEGKKWLLVRWKRARHLSAEYMVVLSHQTFFIHHWESCGFPVSFLATMRCLWQWFIQFGRRGQNSTRPRGQVDDYARSSQSERLSCNFVMLHATTLLTINLRKTFESCATWQQHACIEEEFF